MSIETIPKRDRVDERDGAAIRHCLERVYSEGELHVVDQLVASDFVGASTESSVPYLGVEGFKAHVIGLRSVFNGFSVTIDELHVEGDTFEVAWTASGTHERRFLGIDPACDLGRVGEEPHGNRIAVAGLTTGTMSDGQIETSRMTWDVAELRRQLASPVERGVTPVGSFGTGDVSDVTTTAGSDAGEGTLGMGHDSTSLGGVRDRNVS